MGLILGMAGCSHGELEKRLDAKLVQEAHIKTRSDFNAETRERIEGMSGLTTEQRTQLLALRATSQNEMELLNQQSLRLRMVLVQDLIQPDYDDEEVQLIKRKIQKAEERKVSIIFTVADQVNRILGRVTTPHHKRAFDDIIGYGR